MGSRTRCQRVAPWVKGSVSSTGGEVPVVSTRLDARDRIGAFLVRWDLGRGRYSVRPGLYAVGAPKPSSPVLVTANYKLTFDSVRRELGGTDAWILVLDTRGVNVWCAAGKGTFGTEELIDRIEATGIGQVVTHRRLILPQLGATGVSAHEVRERSGFSVAYGPVRAADIPAYLSSGLRKTAEMRRVRFGLRDRVVVTPVELAHVLPFAAGLLVITALLVLLRGGAVDLGRSVQMALPVWGAMAAGSILVPLLLPLLPGKPFSVKGAALGAVWAVAACLAYRPSIPGIIGMALLLPAASAFLAMSFTGSTTFTSLSGVKVEVRVATPVIAVAAAIGAILYIVAALTGGIV